MSSTDPTSPWARLDALFEELADRSPEEQAARLDALRADDPALATRLEALLRYDRRDGQGLTEAVHNLEPTAVPS